MLFYLFSIDSFSLLLSVLQPLGSRFSMRFCLFRNLFIFWTAIFLRWILTFRSSSFFSFHILFITLLIIFTQRFSFSGWFGRTPLTLFILSFLFIFLISCIFLLRAFRLAWFERNITFFRVWSTLLPWFDRNMTFFRNRSYVIFLFRRVTFFILLRSMISWVFTFWSVHRLIFWLWLTSRMFGYWLWLLSGFSFAQQGISLLYSFCHSMCNPQLLWSLWLLFTLSLRLFFIFHNRLFWIFWFAFWSGSFLRAPLLYFFWCIIFILFIRF